MSDRKEFGDVDTKSIDYLHLEESMEHLQGSDFYDPDVNGELEIYGKKSIRATNKEQSREALDKFYRYNDIIRKR